MMTTTHATVAERLAAIIERIRERAVETRTFDRAVADDLEELSRIASVVAAVTTELRELDEALERAKATIA
jgi:hypothetical protein